MPKDNKKKQQTTFRDSYAIEICENRVALVHISRGAKISKPMVKICDFRVYKTCSDITDCFEMTRAIFSLVDKHNLYDVNFSLVLQPIHYRLLLIDAPNVPLEEYKAAIRWQIKDMIDFPLDDATVDYFRPSETIEACKKKIYTVVARTSFLLKLYEVLQKNLINIASIDITELALRNILSPLNSMEEPIALLQITLEDVALIIAHKKSVYFIRRIPLSLFKIVNNDETANLIVEEIQRSLNYCQTELKQKAPRKLLIAPLLMEHRHIAEKALHNLGMEVDFFDINQIIASAAPFSIEQQAHCYVAIGAALREE